jgi:hypothetical protein
VIWEDLGAVTKEAQILTETIKKQTNHISFSINSEDGGLDIVYTE